MPASSQSRAAQLADAVTAALTGHTFSMEFAAERSWQPKCDVKEIADLAEAAGGEVKVYVTPRSRATTRLNRHQNDNRHAIDLSFLAVIGANATATDQDVQDEVDALAALVEEVADHLDRTVLEVEGVDGVPHSVAGVAIEPMASLTHLDELRVFFSVVTVTYREVRAVA